MEKKNMVGKPFKLESWYASEHAKRSFGRICQAVWENNESITLLGTASQPLLVLADAEEHDPEPGDIVITIDEAKADWPAVTTAAAVYGTKFRIQGKKIMRAVLFRHPAARHPAERYLRSSSPDTNRLAQQLEELAKEVRRLGQKIARTVSIQPTEDFGEIASRLTRSAELIDRRFRQLWRGANGCAATSA